MSAMTKSAPTGRAATVIISAILVIGFLQAACESLRTPEIIVPAMLIAMK